MLVLREESEGRRDRRERLVERSEVGPVRAGGEVTDAGVVDRGRVDGDVAAVQRFELLELALLRVQLKHGGVDQPVEDDGPDRGACRPVARPARCRRSGTRRRAGPGEPAPPSAPATRAPGRLAPRPRTRAPDGRAPGRRAATPSPPWWTCRWRRRTPPAHPSAGPGCRSSSCPPRRAGRSGPPATRAPRRAPRAPARAAPGWRERTPGRARGRPARPGRPPRAAPAPAATGPAAVARSRGGRRPSRSSCGQSTRTYVRTQGLFEHYLCAPASVLRPVDCAAACRPAGSPTMPKAGAGRPAGWPPAWWGLRASRRRRPVGGSAMGRCDHLARLSSAITGGRYGEFFVGHGHAVRAAAGLSSRRPCWNQQVEPKEPSSTSEPRLMLQCKAMVATTPEVVVDPDVDARAEGHEAGHRQPPPMTSW